MVTATRGVWKALLVPMLVLAGVQLALLGLLLPRGVDTGELGWCLALSLVLGLTAGVATAVSLYLRAHRRLIDPLTAVVEDVSHLLDPDDLSIESLGGERDLAGLTSTLRRFADRADQRMSLIVGEREHLLTVLASMSEGVMVSDSDGRTVLVNRPWRELFGVIGDVQGRSALEVTRQTSLDRMIALTLRSGEGEQIEIEVARERRLTIILTSSPLPDGAGVVVLARDLTPLLRVAEIRRDFIANVSHELKTPLSAIRGFAETLDQGALDDRVAAVRFTRRILKQCERLEALLSDLLALSRLEHPTARSSWAAVDLASLVRETIDLARDGIAERGLELVVDLDPVPGIQGDAEALVRLATNLLENAIKYNRPGGRVEVRLTENDGWITLEVADTGIGIPAESIERLFERFYRVDKGRSRDEGGTGLGLAIVKHAAQLHGGAVEVESKLATGSRFHVSIPLAGPSTPSKRTPRTEPPVARL